MDSGCYMTYSTSKFHLNNSLTDPPPGKGVIRWQTLSCYSGRNICWCGFSTDCSNSVFLRGKETCDEEERCKIKKRRRERMSTLLSSWSQDVQSVPQNYVFPEDDRPGGDIAAPVCKDIPVIDLGLDRVAIIQQIMKASMHLGMFQVINHGVSEEQMDETINLFKEFFNMPAEDKAMYHTEDPTKGFGLYTSGLNKGINTWKDTMRHMNCELSEDNIQSWPEKPARYREVVRAYLVEVRKLTLKILDLICEGLGIESGYFAKELSQIQQLQAHNYPPCPEPSLVLGLLGHNDPNLLTLVQQEGYGLQIFNGELWLGVEPIPRAFVINTADLFQIISNGKLKSARHRVVTNTKVTRTSLAIFVSPHPECVVEPAKALVSASEPQLFKSNIQGKEYRDVAFANLRDGKSSMTVDAFKL